MRNCTVRNCSRCGLRKPINDEANVWCHGCTSVIGQCRKAGVEAPQCPGRAQRLKQYIARAAKGLPVLDGDYGPAEIWLEDELITRYDVRKARGLCGLCGVRPRDGESACCKRCKKRCREYQRRKSSDCR